MDIRNILSIISEASAPFSKKMKVMSLSDFVKSELGSKEAEMDEAKLSGVKSRKFDEPELTAYLDRILAKEKETKDKYKLPYIHSSEIPIVDKDGKKYDLDKLRETITQRPTRILKQNEKMQHSDGTSSIFYNVGLPALKGLAVDEETGDFVVIDTCPGAGECKLICYAMKGGYVQWSAVFLSQTRLLNFLYNDPNGFMAMLASEIKNAEEKYSKKDTKLIVRWHDAGDFFSPEYLKLAYELAKKFPNVDFYAYTKLANVAKGAKPDNFLINFSMGAQPGQEKQIDYKEVKHSKVVPKELFTDLVHRVEKETGKTDKKTGKPKTVKKLEYKTSGSVNALKQRLAAKYSIDPKSILTYDEMMKTPQGAPNQYNVIVKPGDGDDSANRRDVLGTYLLHH